MATSLATLRSKVRSRYERNAVASNFRKSFLDICVNQALREIYNRLGDNAWFLRRTASVTLLPFPATTTIANTMRRLYRLEDEGVAPGRPIDWRLIRHNADLSMVIQTCFAGPATAHYMHLPDDLVYEDDEALLPDQHLDLAVLLSCQRLAESVGSAGIIGNIEMQLPSLWDACKRDALRYGGMRHEPLQYNRNTSHPAFPF